MPTPRIRILLVDDHPLVRRGLRAVLAEWPQMEVVGEADNGLEALRQAAALQPDVILLDLVMPVMDGVQVTRQVCQQFPQIKILVLTSFTTDDKIFPAIQAGALGYLLKDASSDDLPRAITRVYHGELSLTPSIARKVLQALGRTEPHAPVGCSAQTLTSRELLVLRLLAQGLDNTAIAERLTIAEVTVRTHISHILDKLQVDNRVQAALYALREGLVDLNSPLTTGEP